MSGSGIVVAIDGPAGSGKSSVAREAAVRLGFDFLDTGAAYRALGWLVLEHRADPDDEAAVLGVLEGFEYETTLDTGERRVFVGGTDVTRAIREPRVSAAASRVARVPAVRRRVNERFRAIIDAEEHGIVVEGRDITTVVAPDADVRVLLTAAPEVRASRRVAELGLANDADGIAAALETMRERDERDRQTVDFMKAAEEDGVHVVDSTELDFRQTVQAIVDLVREAGFETPPGAAPQPKGFETPPGVAPQPSDGAA